MEHIPRVYFCSWCPIRSVIYISTFVFSTYNTKMDIKENTVNISVILSYVLQKKEPKKVNKNADFRQTLPFFKEYTLKHR